MVWVFVNTTSTRTWVRCFVKIIITRPYRRFRLLLPLVRFS